ncbi:MAG: hypothetical protein ACYCZO_12235 [Daejeonella sp.]
MIKSIRHLYVKDFKPIEYCGKTVFWQFNLDGILEFPFEIEPTEGDHDFNKCDKCKATLKELTKRFKARFDGNENRKAFPFCCPHHANLVKIEEFNRAFFVNVPEMVAKKMIYTTQHIYNNQNLENWYKVITDYIEWVILSFGQMPNDCGERLYLHDYFFYVTDNLKIDTEIPKEKKNRILEYLNQYQIPTENAKTDLSVLLNTYQKWLKIFPFEISYFRDIKEQFEKQLPILSGLPEVNMYSGLTKAKLHTKSSLIDALINLTNNLLTQINGATIYEKGLITDTTKIKLELIINSRKLKLKQGYKNSSPDEEHRYRKILKEWFNDEKKFIDEIGPLLNVLPAKQMERKDLKGWFPFGNPDWKEVAYQRNIGAKYQHKQDLVSVFGNGYINYEMKLDAYVNEFQEIPHDFLNNLIFEFRKSFPKNGRVQDISYFDDLIELLIEKYSNRLFNKEDKQVKQTMNPIFKPEHIPTIFELLKDFFSMEQQAQLKKVLETGGETSDTLLFLDTGNRLADAFKQLINADVITGCQKKELESWIQRNFKYRYRQEIKSFTPRYLNDIISTLKDKCQKPILSVTIAKPTGSISITNS